MAKKGGGLGYIIMAIERRKGKERKRAWLSQELAVKSRICDLFCLSLGTKTEREREGIALDFVVNNTNH